MHRLSLAAIALCLTTSPLLAADLNGPADRGYEAAAPAYVTPRWSGIYGGVHVGYGWSQKDWTLIENAGGELSNRIGQVVTSHDADGWLGGVQLGLNHQMGSFVVGLEGEFTWTDMSGYSTWVAQGGPNAGAFRDASTDINWMATIAARAGVTLGASLLYLKGGVAWADEDYSHTGGSLRRVRFMEGGETRSGWLLGVGWEHALDRNWSVKAEYNYIDFGDERVSLSDPTRAAIFDIEQDVHAFKVGLNYRFGRDEEPAPLK